MSMAAAVALGGFLALQTNALRSDGMMSSQSVQVHAGGMVNASFDLDVENAGQEEVKDWLVSHKLPTPSVLPKGLQGLESLGCKKIDLPEGQLGSLLSFKEASGNKVNVIIVKNNIVNDGNIPTMEELSMADCYFCKKTGLDVARWHDDENTYIMMVKPQEMQNNTLMRYF